MAKKSRRTKIKSSASRPVAVQQRQNSAVQPIKGKGGNGTATATTVISSERYAYVTKDLISIGITAGSLLVVLIILTFILR